MPNEKENEMKEWTPKLSFKIGSDKESGLIGITDAWNALSVTYMNTREKAVMEELIKLGWTPPASGGCPAIVKDALKPQMNWEDELQHTIDNQKKVIDELRSKRCPYIIQSKEGTAHCELAEGQGRQNVRLKELLSQARPIVDLASYVTGSQASILLEAIDKELSVTK